MDAHEQNARRAREMVIALTTCAPDVLSAVGAPPDRPNSTDSSNGREFIGGWWTDFKKRVKRSAEKGWDAFVDSLSDSLDQLGDWDSFSDVLQNLKTIATGGALEGGSAVGAAAETALREVLNFQAIGRAIGKAYTGRREAVVEAAKRAAPNTRFAQDLAGAIAGEAFDLALGKPECVCEKACIGPVAAGLRKTQGVPAIIGAILEAVYPIVQLENAPWDSAALYMYAGKRNANGIQLLPNVKLDDTSFVGNILDFVSSVKGITISTPRAFVAYSPWLVDLVARGYQGPVAHGTTKRSARWYFERPDKALEVIEDADKIASMLSEFSRVLGRIIKWVEWAKKAYDTGKQVYDGYQAYSKGDMREALVMAAREYTDPATLERLGQGLWDRGRECAIEEATAAARRALEDVEVVRWVQGLEGGIRRLGYAVPQLDGSVRGTASAWAADWMPATIGLMARAKYQAMLELWIAMTPAERARWKTKRDWERKGSNPTDFPAWYNHFEKSDKVKQIGFQQMAPVIYGHNMAYANYRWGTLNFLERAAMRANGLGDIAFGGFDCRIPKSPRAPSVRDIGWPIGLKRPESMVAKPGQYMAWAQDFYDAHDTKRHEAREVEIDRIWQALSVASRKAWFNHKVSWPTAPSIAFEKVEGTGTAMRTALTSKLAGSSGVRFTPVTFQRYWARIMVSKYPGSLESPDVSTPTYDVARMLQPTITVELEPHEFPQVKRDEPAMGAELIEETSKAVPIALGVAGLALLGMAALRKR